MYVGTWYLKLASRRSGLLFAFIFFAAGRGVASEDSNVLDFVFVYGDSMMDETNQHLGLACHACR
jgi:hypothetical protein